MTEPRVETTRYTVTDIPEDAPPDAWLYTVTVSRHRDGTWSVGDGDGGGGTCYGPPGPHFRRAECFTEHRYTEDEAIRVAKSVAPKVAAPVLARMAKRAESGAGQ